MRARWSLDRARLAELLGCDGIVEHAKDAAWQADVYLELLATLAIAATHQSQLGQDFEIYASQEFGLVELADAHSRASALMPQKKNPYALAAIRTQAGQAAGDVASALAALHTGSARTDHFHLLNGTVPRALDEAVAIARLTASVLDGIELRTERFAQIARESFVTAADVADVLALTGDIDYRSAHKIVGRAVRDLVDAGEPSSQLTPDRLAAASVAAIGRPVEIDEATLRDALDPAACAAARRQAGSSSEAAMDEMLDEIHATLTAHESWSQTARERESAAETALLARARDLASKLQAVEAPEIVLDRHDLDLPEPGLLRVAPKGRLAHRRPGLADGCSTRPTGRQWRIDQPYITRSTSSPGAVNSSATSSATSATPPSASSPRIARSASTGFAMSWTASNTVTRS